MYCVSWVGTKSLLIRKLSLETEFFMERAESTMGALIISGSN